VVNEWKHRLLQFAQKPLLLHFPDAPTTNINKRKSGDKWRKAEQDKYFVNSGDLVKWLIEHNILQPIRFADYDFIPTIKKPTLNEIKCLEYDKFFCISDFKQDIE